MAALSICSRIICLLAMGPYIALPIGDGYLRVCYPEFSFDW